MRRSNEIVHPVSSARKTELLHHLITTGNLRSVLVFTRNRLGAGRLAMRLLRSGLTASALDAKAAKPVKDQIVEEFNAGEVRILASVDAAVRGFSIKTPDAVVNFDFPTGAGSYNERAAAGPRVVSLVSKREERLLKAVETGLKRPLKREVIFGFAP